MVRCPAIPDFWRFVDIMTIRIEEYILVDRYISILIRVVLITEIVLTSKRTIHNNTVQYRTVGISKIDVVRS